MRDHDDNCSLSANPDQEDADQEDADKETNRRFEAQGDGVALIGQASQDELFCLQGGYAPRRLPAANATRILKP